MHPKRQKKLILLLLLVLGLTAIVAMTGYALRSNLDHFYTPQAVSLGQVAEGQRLKIGGLVKANSVQHSQEDLSLSFIVTDTIADVTVHYQGILPDLFREGQGVVVQGVYSGHLQIKADKVLAKHDEKYMPPEAARAMMDAAKQRTLQSQPIKE